MRGDRESVTSEAMNLDCYQEKWPFFSCKLSERGQNDRTLTDYSELGGHGQEFRITEKMSQGTS